MQYKTTGLVLATGLFSALAWYYFGRIFQHDRLFIGNYNWTIFILSLGLAYGFLCLLSFSKNRRVFIAAALMPPFFFLLFNGISLKLVIAALVLAAVNIRFLMFPDLILQTMSLNYFRVAFRKYSLLILVLFSITAIFFQQNIYKDPSNRNFAEKSVNQAWPYIRTAVPQFNSEKTVNQYLTEQYKENGVDRPSQANLADGRAQISRQVNFPLVGNEKMSDVGKKFLTEKLNSYFVNLNFEKNSGYLIFIALITFWPLFKLVFASITTLLYLIMRKSNVVKVVEIPVTAKTLEI